MRLARPLFLASVALSSLATPAQHVFESKEPSKLPHAIMDVLNNDTDYELLIGLLQRAKLIPTLNKLNGSAFFAPTNDAIKRHFSSSDLWSEIWYGGVDDLADNIQEKLRQQLFYHLVNYTITDVPQDRVLELETLHYPKVGVDPPSRDPPPYPPWMPIKKSTLGDKPQRLRFASREEQLWVGADVAGNGGIQLVADRAETEAGDVFKVDGMLDTPLDISRVIADQPSLSYFNKIRTSQIGQALNGTSGMTLFMPVDSAWQSLPELERLYLESEFAEDDLTRILNMHAVVKEGVHWSDSFEKGLNLTTAHGSTLEITSSSGHVQVSNSSLVQGDIYASNGVLHLVDSLLVPPGAFQLTPEKYLLALNCTSFISLVHGSNLTHLINDTAAEYTILAPRDDVIKLFSDGDLPKPGTEELKKLLEYHFIPGKYTPKKLNDGMLLETALKEKGLDYASQVLQVETDPDVLEGVDPQHVRFGGASTIGEHVEFGNSLVYFMSRPLELPSDPLQTALPSLDLSSFLAAIFSTSLADAIKTQPRTTFLIPHNNAFKRLGMLVSDHLLAASSKSDLENVILHHILDSVRYTSNLFDGSQRTYATLQGSDVQLDRQDNETILLTASGGWAGMRSALRPRNTLTSTGVIHEVSDIMIPRSVNLNVAKLMKAAKGTTMVSMLSKAGFDWILNGTAPPEGSKWAEAGLGGGGWTVLCPTDDAFKKTNITQLLGDTEALERIVGQHLVPYTPSSGSSDTFGPFEDTLNNNRPLPMEQLGTYSTLLSPSSAYGDVAFRELDMKSPTGYMVGIKNARGTDGKADWARVMSWGRATTGGGKGGVIQIDRLLYPYQPPWWIEYGAPSIVGAIGVVVICGFFYGVNIFMKRDTTEATFEPAGGFGGDDDEDS